MKTRCRMAERRYRDIADAADRIRAAREAARAAAVPIVIDVRTDLYLGNIGDEAARFDETVTRGNAYLAAGADCFYPITLRDSRTIARLVKALAAPININFRAGLPNVADLEALGVARASEPASQVSLMAMATTCQIAEELRKTASIRSPTRNACLPHPDPQISSRYSSFAQDHVVTAFRLDRCGKAEIVIPADKFKPPAQLDEAEKLLREEDLRRDPSFNVHVFPVIVDGEGQAFVVCLRYRIEQLGAIAGMHSHPVSLPSPASPVVVENAKPDKAV